MPANAAYWSYWGLRQTPFRAAANSDFYHLGPTHDEALARLHFLVENRRRLGLVLGEPGSGKSLLLARLAGELDREGIDAITTCALEADAMEFLSMFAIGLGLNVPGEHPPHVWWARLTDRLAERRYQRLATVLLVDDADRASEAALTTIARLLQLDSWDPPNLTVVLAVVPARMGRLGARLLDLADLRVDLEPWTAEETAEYLEHSLAKAGRGDSLFDSDAVERLYELSGGRPRRVGQLADLALIAAAGERRLTIDRDTIETVHRELAVGSQASAGTR